MRSIPLDFYTTHHQFFLIDKDTVVDPQTEMWSEQAFADKLVVLPGWLSIGTGSYGPVKGIMRIQEEEPDLKDMNAFDHIVEGSIKINSGVIELIACPFNQADYSVTLAQGTYRVRISSSGLETVEGDEGNDFYELDIWLAPFKTKEVLKRY